MEFDAFRFDPNSTSGEAVPIDVTNVLAFTGLGGSGKLITTIARDAVQALRPLFNSGAQTIERTAFKPSILDRLFGVVKNPKTIITGSAVTGGATAATQLIKISTPSTLRTLSRDATIITGLGTVGLLSLQTQQGQNILDAGKEAAKDSVGVLKTAADFLQKNPIIVVGSLLIVGFVLIGGKK